MRVDYTPDGDGYYRIHSDVKSFSIEESKPLEQPIGFINFDKLKKDKNDKQR